MWRASIDCASNALGGSEHFTDGSGEGAGHRTGSHYLGDGDDIIEGDVSAVLD